MLKYFRTKLIYKYVSLFLILLMDMQIIIFNGCDDKKDNPKTKEVESTIITDEIGGSGLKVRSAYKDSAVVKDGRFETIVSTRGTQILFISDTNQNIRALTLSVITDNEPQILNVDARSTAYSLLMLTPGITTTSVEETSNRINQFEQLSSFSNFVNHLKNNLSQKTLKDLLNENQTQDIFLNCVQEYFSVNQINKRKIIEYKNYFDVTKESNNSVKLSNYGWRYVNIYRRDLKNDLSEKNVHTISAPMAGVKPLSWGTILTSTVNDPTIISDTYNPGSDVLKSEYWIIGPGFQTIQDIPPSSISTNINSVCGMTMLYYLFFPVIDLFLGTSELINVPFDAISSAWSSLQGSVNINDYINSTDPTSRNSALYDFAFTAFPLVLDILVVAGYISASVGVDIISAIALLGGIVFGIPNIIAFNWYFQTTNPITKFEIMNSNNTLPVISTSSISNITTNSASCGGTITSDGGSPVTARGVCWSTSHNPTTANSKTSNGSGTGSFTSTITGLSANTTYYVRAYATNNYGTSYGANKTFKTLNSIAQDLVAYYPFNGNANDESGNGNHGTVYGATLTNDRFGNSNKAYYFNGISDSIVCGNNISLQSNSVTISCWINYNGTLPYNFAATVINKATKGYDGYAIFLSNYHIGVEPSRSGTWNTVYVQDSIKVGSWYHVAFTYNNSNHAVKIYWNGQFKNSITFQMATPISSRLIIGHGYNTVGSWGTKGFKGKIDDIRIYDKALTVDEVIALYNE